MHGHIEKGRKCNYEYLRALLAIVRMERARFPGGVTFERIPRVENKEADRLATEAKAVSAKMNAQT